MPSPALKQFSVEELYSALQKRVHDVLSAPPEILKWTDLPNLSRGVAPAQIRFPQQLRPKSLSYTQSIYDDAIKPAQPKLKSDAADLDEQTISDELVARTAQTRKSLYGTGDHRMNLYDAEIKRLRAVAVGDQNPIEARYLQAAQSVGLIVHASVLRKLPSNDYYIMADAFGSTNSLCDTEFFLREPSINPGGIGTAFIVGEQIAYTAAHCLPDNIPSEDLRMVFGFALLTQNIPPTVIIAKDDVYSIKKVIKHKYTETAEDWAVFKLDRVTTRKSLKLGSGTPALGASVYALGYPSALPLKISPAGKVEKATGSNRCFLASVDAFGGSSGSPVFNGSTHEVEGILVRGNEDFRMISNGHCNRSVLITSAHQGEAVCSISVVPKP